MRTWRSMPVAEVAKCGGAKAARHSSPQSRRLGMVVQCAVRTEREEGAGRCERVSRLWAELAVA